MTYFFQRLSSGSSYSISFLFFQYLYIFLSQTFAVILPWAWNVHLPDIYITYSIFHSIFCSNITSSESSLASLSGIEVLVLCFTFSSLPVYLFIYFLVPSTKIWGNLIFNLCTIIFQIWTSLPIIFVGLWVFCFYIFLHWLFYNNYVLIFYLAKMTLKRPFCYNHLSPLTNLKLKEHLINLNEKQWKLEQLKWQSFCVIVRGNCNTVTRR